MDAFLQHLVNGLVLGGTYALLGIGLTLIFGIMRVVNFTHGELYAFGAYMMYMLVMISPARTSSLLSCLRSRLEWRWARRWSSCSCVSYAAPISTPPCS
jgi:branched-subunit amino acid ABC-type transport system permease component